MVLGVPCLVHQVSRVEEDLGRDAAAMQTGAAEDGITLDDIAVHDETNPMLASMLARMTYPEFPVAVGVLFAERRPTYDGTIGAQQRAAKERSGAPDLAKLLRGNNTWTI